MLDKKTFKQYKKIVIINKNDKTKLLDMIQYLRTLEYNIYVQQLIELILSYLDIHYNNEILSNLKKSYNKKPIHLIDEPINDFYLFDLLNDLKIDLNDTNDYMISLLNLLTDKNYTINHIGIKINIVKYLLNIDLKDLNILKVKNSYLSDNFSFLSYKNDKTKHNKNKLLFKNDLIIINSLDSDRIYSIVIYHKNNKSIDEIMNSYINENITTTNIKHLDLKNNQYTVVDTENIVFSFISDLINILKLFNNDYNDTNIVFSDINDLNLFDYIAIIKENYKIFQRYDKLQYKYDYIMKYLKDTDLFKSNSLDLTNNKKGIVIENFNDLNSYDTFNYSNKEQKLFEIKYKKDTTIKSKFDKINRLLDL